MKNSLVLLILDGWGLGENNKNVNPFAIAKTPAINYIEKYFPSGSLQSSGITVGLPWKEPGDSESGHLTIGSGRVVYQNYPKISKSIKDGSFFKNEALENFLIKIKEKDSNLHLIGLLSSNHIHSDYWHIISLLRAAKSKGIKKTYLHLFGDGIDAPQQEAVSLIKKIKGDLKKVGTGEIASFSGRYYAMDRTQHWERTKMVYDLLVSGVGEETSNLEEYLKENYRKGLPDNLIKPTLVLKEGKKIFLKEDDGLFFFNFKEDRIKQLFLSFSIENFKYFKRENQKNIFIASIIKYLKETSIPYLFSGLEPIKNTLSEILSKKNLIQLKIAETERYAHITYFFNGLNNYPFPGENRILIPSFFPHQFKDHPEMKSKEITDRLIQGLDEFAYDLIVTNYVGADTSSRIGEFELTIKAIEAIDYEIGRVLKKCLENDHTLIIVGSCANAEELKSPYTGEIETNRTTNPVPIYIINKKMAKNKSAPFNHLHIPETSSGLLSDITPTILEILKISPPTEVEGTSLLNIIY